MAERAVLVKPSCGPTDKLGMKMLLVVLAIVTSPIHARADSASAEDFDFDSAAVKYVTAEYAKNGVLFAGPAMVGVPNGCPLKFKEARVTGGKTKTYPDSPTRDHTTEMEIVFESADGKTGILPYALSMSKGSEEMKVYSGGFRNVDSESREKETDYLLEKDPLAKFKGRVRDAIRKREIYRGMPDAAVSVSWGRPERVNETVTSAGLSKQYVYGLRRYVYTVNGKVASWQTSKVAR